jgi:hypothetical protein
MGRLVNIRTKQELHPEFIMLNFLPPLSSSIGNVPANYRTTDNPPRALGRWINRQRSAFVKDKLKTEYVEKLNTIGLKWSVHERRPVTADQVMSGCADNLDDNPDIPADIPAVATTTTTTASSAQATGTVGGIATPVPANISTTGTASTTALGWWR